MEYMDRVKFGSIAWRHESYKEEGYKLAYRRVQMALANIGIDLLGFPKHGDTGADHSGFLYWEPSTRGIGSWSPAWPCIAMSGGLFLPINNQTWQPDERFIRKYLSLPPNIDSVPEGTIGIAIAAVKEDGPGQGLFLPSSLVEGLIAANRNPDFNDGTNVFDLDENGKADQNFFAKLQSVWQVMEPDYGNNAPEFYTSPGPITSSIPGQAPGGFFAAAAVGVMGAVGPNQITLFKNQNTGPKNNGYGSTVQVGIINNPGINFKPAGGNGKIGDVINIGGINKPGVVFKPAPGKAPINGVVPVGVNKIEDPGIKFIPPNNKNNNNNNIPVGGGVIKKPGVVFKPPVKKPPQNKGVVKNNNQQNNN